MTLKQVRAAYIRGWDDAMIAAADRIEDCVMNDAFYKCPTNKIIDQALADDAIWPEITFKKEKTK